MTAAPQLTSADFLAAAQDLLPQGYAWPRQADATLTLFWQAVADRFAALHTRSLELLLVEAYPATTAAALLDWERAFGLPDECSPGASSTAQRRAALLARMAALGGQSRAYFVSIAAALGVTITITEFRPARVGFASVGDPIRGLPWSFAWRVNAPATTVSYARSGFASAGDALATWGNETLECVFQRLKPAQTTVIFAYS